MVRFIAPSTNYANNFTEEKLKIQTKRKKLHHPQITIINTFMYCSLYLFGAVHQCESTAGVETHTYWLCDLQQVT